MLDNPLPSDLNKEEQMSEDLQLLNLNFKAVLQILLYFWYLAWFQTVKSSLEKHSAFFLLMLKEILKIIKQLIVHVTD